MRFLCLHGKGTSARIFKSQTGMSWAFERQFRDPDGRISTNTPTASFRKLLPENYIFDFIDGPFPDGPAAGVDLFYRPPYFKLYEQFTLESLKEGHKWLLAYIEGLPPSPISRPCSHH